MTKKEFWLKLFSENDTALAVALIFVDRFVTKEQLESGKEYIENYKKGLYEDLPEEYVKSVFPNYHPTEKAGVE